MGQSKSHFFAVVSPEGLYQSQSSFAIAFSDALCKTWYNSLRSRNSSILVTPKTGGVARDWSTSQLNCAPRRSEGRWTLEST